MKEYMLKMPKKVISGLDSIKQIKNVFNELECEKVVILTNDGIYKAGVLDSIIKLVDEENIKYELVTDLPIEPKKDEVLSVLNTVKDMNPQLLIGVGGGSVIDTTKLVSVLINQEYTLDDIVEDSSKVKKGIATLMIPTTSGTGAEATPNAIILIPELELKIGIVNDNLISDYVILDAGLTLELPGHITASTGIDALSHAMECYISKKANPFTDVFALKAIELVFKNLENVYKNPKDIEGRNSMLLSSFYGGVCITTSSTVAVHALSYPLGGKYGIPHGISNAILLGDIMEYNMPKCIKKYSKIADVINPQIMDKDNLEKARYVVEILKQLIKSINIDTSLDKYNITSEDIPSLVEGAAKVNRLLDNNPKEMSKEDIEKIYRKII